MKPAERDIRAHLPLRPVEFLVLSILGDGELHGYGIVQEMKARTDGVVDMRPGDLYRVLYRLTERGLAAIAERRTVTDAGERRTYYTLTRLGRSVLHAEADLLSSIIARVERSAP